MAGILDKSVVGDASGGVVHHIWLDPEGGPVATGQFLTLTQKIINNWLIKNGFSVGCSDIFLEEESKKEIKDDLTKVEEVIKDLFEKAKVKDKMDRQPGKSMIESYETNINMQLNSKWKEACSKAKNAMSENNRIFNMVAAGSKGSEMNIAQITATVGQQNVEGKRIKFGFSERTLPHFWKGGFNI